MIYKRVGERLQEERVKLTEKLGKVSVNQEAVAKETLCGKTLDMLTEAEKLQCARSYFLTGNLSAIAREYGIFYNDLLELARSASFQEEVKNLEREANAQLKVKMTTLLGKSLEALEDRLEHGDWKLTKQGEIQIPVSARDLATISHIMFEKKKAIEEAEAGFGSNEAKRLLSIADALKARGLEAKPVAGILESEVLENEIDP